MTTTNQQSPSVSGSATRPKKRLWDRLSVADDEDRDGVSDKTDYGGGAGLGEGGGNKMVLSSRFLGFSGEIQTQKHHWFKSYAYARRLLVDTTNVNKIYMTTPLMEVPWDQLFFYLTEGELDALPPYCWVKHVHITIVQRPCRAAFSTNVAQSGLATLHQNKYVAIARNLNNIPTIHLQNCRYTVQATKPMVPIGVGVMDPTTYTELSQHMYGLNNTAPDFKTIIPQSLTHGMIRAYGYATFVNRLDAAVGGWPCLENHIKTWYATETDGDTICTMDYTPQMSVLKDDRKYFHTAPEATYSTYIKKGEVEAGLRTFTVGNGTAVQITDVYQTSGKGHTQSSGATASTIQSIEVSHRILEHGMGTSGYKNQPSVHIGQWECGRFSPEGAESGGVFDSFTDIEGEWEVHAKMTIGYDKQMALAMNGDNSVKSVFSLNYAAEASGGTLTFDDTTWKFQGMHKCTGTINN